MEIAAIIPARYNSKRFKGKPLVKINGITMIERVYIQVKKSKKFSDIIVATDDKRIAKVVKDFGGNFKLTSEKHKSGTDRVWEVLKNSDYDAIVNIQGDEPLISEELIAGLYEKLQMNKYDVITAAYFNTSYDDFISKNIVKVVFNKSQKALYFSRSPIPFQVESNFQGFYQHIGIYGYTRSALKKFVESPLSDLESIEKLEQLRFIGNDIKINVIKTNYQSYGVDVPEDIIKLESILKDDLQREI